jgi:hypothetical protein
VASDAEIQFALIYVMQVLYDEGKLEIPKPQDYNLHCSTAAGF